MPKVSKWNTYFKSLSKEARFELWKALKTLEADEMFHENYHQDFYELVLMLEDIGV